MSPIRLLLPLAFLLSACGAVTLSGLNAASQLDPLTTPPGDVAVAVSLPTQVRLSDGDATLRLSLTGPDGPLVDRTVPLRIADPDAALPGLARGDRAVIATIPADAAQDFAAAQAEIRRLRDAGAGGTGSLTIAIRSGCLTGPLGETLPVATWLRPAPGASFVRLTRRTDMLTQLPPNDAAALRAALSPCP